MVSRGPDAARDRHFAAHPEDRDANVVIFEFFDDEEVADAPAGPSCEEPVVASVATSSLSSYVSCCSDD